MSMETTHLSDAEWRARLTPEQYAVLREKATERPFSGEYEHEHRKGTYTCAGCGQTLFESDAKFDSGCGWPSFYQPSEGDAVILLEDRSLGRARTEVRCASCNSHLGHVFEGEGYGTPTDLRYCINSVSIRNIENSAVPRMNPATFAPVTVLIRKIENDINGSLVRRSTTTKAPRSAAARAKSPIVFADVHP